MKAGWKPAAESPAREMYTEMKEVNKATEGLADSKHAVKELSEADIDQMVKERGLEWEKVDDEDREMEEEKE